MKAKVSKNLANAITLTNMGLGILAIMAAAIGELSGAIYLILIAGILDRLDGMVARRTNTMSELGVQLDSLSDLISFGISPALMVFLFEFADKEGPLFILGALVTVWYVLCGGFRLARYNVIGTVDDCFIGMPITICGMFLVASLLFSQRINPIAYLGLMAILGWLMISRIPIRKR